MASTAPNIRNLAADLVNKAKLQGLSPVEFRIGDDMEPVLAAWMKSLFLVNDPTLPPGKRSFLGLPLVPMKARGFALVSHAQF